MRFRTPLSDRIELLQRYDDSPAIAARSGTTDYRLPTTDFIRRSLCLIAMLALACRESQLAPARDSGILDAVPLDAGMTDEDAGELDDAETRDAEAPDSDAGVDPAICPDPPPGLPQITPEQSGRFYLFRNVPGAGLLARDVTVYVPANYDSEPERRFPVLYMHDGRNVFDAARSSFGVEWQVDETLDRLTNQGTIPPYIAVGVDNTAARTDDYTPDFDPALGDGGNGDAYADFLAGVVKPLVDAHFRTRCVRDETAIAGSSLGGLISLHIALRHPDVFGRIGAVSPAVFWNNGSILNAFTDFGGQLPHRLWIDAGSEESDRGSELLDVWIQGVRDTRDVALAKGMRYGVEVLTLEDVGAAHFEADWAARLGSIFTFLLGDPSLTTRDEIILYSYGNTLNLDGPITRAATTVEARSASLRSTLLSEDVLFESADPAIATITDGIVEARAAGVVEISATVGSLRSTTTISVTDVPMASITLSVTVPSTTPATSFVHLAGSAAQVGAWDPAGFAMTPAGNDRWTATVSLPAGTNFEFKFTRGTWATVERDANNVDVPNRTLAITNDATVDLTVVRWADQ